MTKQLDQSEGKLKGTLLDNLSAEASTPSIRISFFDSDNPTVSRTPSANTKKFLIDPENSQGKPSEWIRCASHATVNGITTLTTVTRGLQRDATIDLTGSADRAQSWDASTTPVGVATEPHNNNLMRAYFTGEEAIPGNMSLSGTNTFTGVTTFTVGVIINGTTAYLRLPVLNDTQKNALTAVEGMLIFCSTSGLPEVYAGGAWTTLDTGVATVNASTTVSGKIEIATLSQATAGTNVGETTAFLSVLPGDIAINNQNNSHIFATSTTGNDTYVANPTPAVTAYSEGQKFLVKVDTANTGACTLNISSLGAVAIKLQTGEDPATGQILANQIIEVVYNSTGPKFVLETTPAQLTGGGDSSELHFHDPVKNASSMKRAHYRFRDTTNAGASFTDNGSYRQVSTAASDNALAQLFISCNIYDPETFVSVHDRNPKFRVRGKWKSATAQEGFLGFVNETFAGTSLENSVLTLDHFGFIVQDGTLFISVANGTTQSKTDISATVPSVTAGHVFEASFDGTTATFYVDNVLVGSHVANVPNGDLTYFQAAVIADASATARVIQFHSDGWISFDET